MAGGGGVGGGSGAGKDGLYPDETETPTVGGSPAVREATGPCPSSQRRRQLPGRLEVRLLRGGQRPPT